MKSKKNQYGTLELKILKNSTRILTLDLKFSTHLLIIISFEQTSTLNTISSLLKKCSEQYRVSTNDQFMGKTILNSVLFNLHLAVHPRLFLSINFTIKLNFHQQNFLDYQDTFPKNFTKVYCNTTLRRHSSTNIFQYSINSNCCQAFSFINPSCQNKGPDTLTRSHIMPIQIHSTKLENL